MLPDNVELYKKDSDLLRALVFYERRYNTVGLKQSSGYQLLFQEAVRRGLRTENLTEQEILTRIEAEGPDMNRPE